MNLNSKIANSEAKAILTYSDRYDQAKDRFISKRRAGCHLALSRTNTTLIEGDQIGPPPAASQTSEETDNVTTGPTTTDSCREEGLAHQPASSRARENSRGGLAAVGAPLEANPTT